MSGNQLLNGYANGITPNVEAFMKLWYLENFTLAHAHSQIVQLVEPLMSSHSFINALLYGVTGY